MCSHFRPIYESRYFWGESRWCKGETLLVFIIGLLSGTCYSTIMPLRHGLWWSAWGVSSFLTNWMAPTFIAWKMSWLWRTACTRCLIALCYGLRLQWVRFNLLYVGARNWTSAHITRLIMCRTHIACVHQTLHCFEAFRVLLLLCPRILIFPSLTHDIWLCMLHVLK